MKRTAPLAQLAPTRPAWLALALALAVCLGVTPGCSNLKGERGVRVQPVADQGQELMAPIRDRDEVLLVVTQAQQLVRLRAAAPGQVLESRPLQGLLPGERLLGLAVHPGTLEVYSLSEQGRFLRIDVRDARAWPISSDHRVPTARDWALSVDPKQNLLRAISDNGRTVRIDIATGSPANLLSEQSYAYASGDLLAGRPARLVASAFHRAGSPGRITHYVIDGNAQYLSVLAAAPGGSADEVLRAGPARLQSVGPLHIERFEHASLDIDPATGHAYLLTQRSRERDARLYEVDLATGRARLIGALALGEPIHSMVIEP